MQTKVISKAENVYLLPQPLFFKLKWVGTISLDLVAFYETKTGKSGGIYPKNAGNLDEIPFIQLNRGDNERTLQIAKIDSISVVYFCTLDFSTVSAKKTVVFNNYKAHLEIYGNQNEIFDIPLTADEQGTIAIIAKIDNTNPIGTKLINVNQIVSLKQLLTDLPGTGGFEKTLAKPQQKKTPEVTVKTGYHFAHQETLPVENNISLLQRWFQRKNIQLDLKEANVDIAGFFDEIAIELGDNYQALADLHGKIKWHQRKGIPNLHVDLSKYDQKTIGKIKKFCQNLLKAAFLTKYYAEKETKKIHLTLQTLPQVINFFNGDWLEWYVFMKVASFLWEKKMAFTYCRGGHLLFPNEDRHEIDLFFLVNSEIPLWIECKSGEFRHALQKYTTLRQRIDMSKANTFLFVMGLSNEESVGLTAMFDVSIVNEQNFLTYIMSCLNR